MSPPGISLELSRAQPSWSHPIACWTNLGKQDAWIIVATKESYLGRLLSLFLSPMIHSNKPQKFAQTGRPAYLPNCLPTYLPTYLPAYLPTC